MQAWVHCTDVNAIQDTINENTFVLGSTLNWMVNYHIWIAGICEEVVVA